MTRDSDGGRTTYRVSRRTVVWIDRLMCFVALGFAYLAFLSVWFIVTLIMNGRADQAGWFSFLCPIFCAAGALWMLFLRQEVAKYALDDRGDSPPQDRT